MARILICHVPKDGNMARELGASLMGRGHFVSFDGEPDAERADRSARLRQFEAVLVLWTETSHASTGLAAIARETLPLNLLIPVRSEDLSLSRIPLAFRKLNMLAPRDAEGVARFVARLSTAAMSLKDMAERDAANLKDPQRSGLMHEELQWPVKHRVRAPAPVVKDAIAYKGQPVRQAEPPPPASVPEPMPQAILSAAEAQRVSRSPLHLDHLPDVSAAGLAPHAHSRAPPPPPARPQQSPPKASPASEPVQSSAVANAQDLSLAVEAGLLLHYIPERMWLGEPATVEVRLARDVLQDFGRTLTQVETLSLSLYGAGDMFEIERQSERTQFVTPKVATGSARDPDTIGRWAWLVTPRSVGEQDLVVRVSALLRDRHGVPVPVALPDRRFRVDVDAEENARVMSSLPGWLRR